MGRRRLRLRLQVQQVRVSERTARARGRARAVRTNVGARSCALVAGVGWRRHGAPALWGRAAQGEAHATVMQLRGGGIILRTLYKVCVVLSFVLSPALPRSIPCPPRCLSRTCSRARSLSLSHTHSLSLDRWLAGSQCLSIGLSVCLPVYLSVRSLFASLPFCLACLTEMCVYILCAECSLSLSDYLPASV